MYIWFIIPSRYEFTMAAIALGAVLLADALGKKHGTRVSRLAVFSFCWGLINPTFVFMAFRALGLPWIAQGDSELRAWFAGTLAVFLGIMALRKIKQSQGEIWGRIFAWIGIISGAVWFVCWGLFGLAIFFWAICRNGGGP